MARGTGLEFALASRGLSAVLAILALGLVALAPARPVSMTPRLVAAAFAATSYVWFEYSQEARSYALCFVLVAGLTGLGLRCLPRLRCGEAPYRLLAGAVLLSILASLSHYYAVLLAGAFFTMLLVFCRSWRGFIAVALSGLCVLAVTVAFMAWHLPRIVLDVSDTWFSADWPFLKDHITWGLGRLLKGGGSKLFLLAIIVTVLLAFVLRPAQGLRTLRAKDAFVEPVVFLAGVFILTAGYGLIVTLGFVQMFSHRVFILLAPVFWIGVAYAVHILLDLIRPGWPALGVASLLALALLGSAAIIRDRGALDSQAWRASAEIVAGFKGCATATLPVLWWDQPFLSNDSPELFYGYYLPPAPARDWITVLRDEASDILAGEEIRALVAATASGARACPVVLWSVHLHGNTTIEQMQALLQAHVPEGTDLSVKAEILLSPDAEYWKHARLFTLE